MRLPKKLAAFLSLFLFSASLSAEPALTLHRLDLPKSFLIKTAFYTVESVQEDPAYPGVLVFKVNSPHAVYKVSGIVSLAKLLREIEVIERIRRNEQTSGFFDGAAAAIGDTGEGFVNLVVHPINSIKGVGKAVGKIGRSIGGIFRSKEEGEKTSFGEKVLGSSERELANQFQVDVYTRNPYLRELLRGMAKSRLGGRSVIAVVKFLIPVAGLASIALTASGVNSTADQIVNDTSTPELFRLNKQALLKMGFPVKDVNDFLNSEYFTPREHTYMRVYLESLQKAAGFRTIFSKVMQAKSENEARKLLYAAQLTADEAAAHPEFTRLEVTDEGIALISKDKLLFLTGYDYLSRSALGNHVINRAQELRSRFDKKTEIWNGGKVTSDFAAFAGSKDIATREWLLCKESK